MKSMMRTPCRPALQSLLRRSNARHSAAAAAAAATVPEPVNLGSHAWGDLRFPEEQEDEVALFMQPTQALPMVTSQEEARALVNDPSVRFVDVRFEASYESGHIPNASWMFELSSYKARSDPAGIDELKTKFGKLFRSAGINKDTRVILYDVAWEKQRGAATRGWYLLNLLGHQNISVLDGGWEAWAKNQDSPKDDEVDLKFDAGDFSPSWRPDLWADKQDVLDVITGKKKAVLLDVRDQDDRQDTTFSCPPSPRPSSRNGARPASRFGEIPTSVKISWKKLINVGSGGEQTSSLKSSEEVCQLLEEAGVSREDDIIVLCFKGTRASCALFQLKRAGFPRVRNYFASWNEWSQDLIKAY